MNKWNIQVQTATYVLCNISITELSSRWLCQI